jgi:hypothetical protein
MARALECPACGHRHRIDAVPSSSTFRCEECGQALKVPTTVSSHPDAPAPPARSTAPPARPGDAATAAATAPPPRRSANRSPDDATRDGAVRAAPAVSATVAASAATAPAGNGDRGGRGDRTNRRDRRGTPVGAPVAAPAPPVTAPARRTKVHWYWRLLAWVVAVPLGFVVTAWPAYELGFIKKDDLLDIFVGTGVGRYLRLAVVTLVWAVVTALLVQLFVEGGRMRADRRRQARAVSA